ncbi:hypothetical protein EN904_14800 [Mesorhizobium sp. M7A.F.Ca.CA.001.07.2.1]|uniref:hypothetical protein n=1 Tax=Mesorhizobium TaxID=68287 RepID=UPI000FCAFF5E|nr:MULTISPECIES: hypothetical protein [Mesorhizobium]RVB42905.1 hypothetical protein EN918_08705 [Mesorhizobium sp. M7A.F.Ca.CA.004.05.1.1]MCF6124371.1 hypothetical protein [Mesorhizobium ciceri]MCQ8816668.1 hypothetical protein [Mesorhizobium sp. SEMIA396]RUX82466.1 hypothetical protein EN983_01140 [Mesorhizobium sp. M7A.F.Ca.CA.004.08.2.1]RUX87229.1 hypothetical protein EN982_11805 [Mesorhizobium sp. M7A.F.Ca.CA.004.08.1.1]
MSTGIGNTQGPVDLAATWLATGSADRTKAIIPQIQERFKLPLKDAVEACRQAALIRARAH